MLFPQSSLFQICYYSYILPLDRSYFFFLTSNISFQTTRKGGLGCRVCRIPRRALNDHRHLASLMAALYLHNAIHIPDLDSTESAHSRHLSALSTPSLRTSTSDSHPTEPLIYFAQSESSTAYQDPLNRQPDYPARIHASWNMSLNLDGDQTTSGERKSRWEKSLRRRLKLLRASKSSLEIVMGMSFITPSVSLI